MIDVENPRRRTTDCGLAVQQKPIPGKMIGPFVSAWIEGALTRQSAHQGRRCSAPCEDCFSDRGRPIAGIRLDHPTENSGFSTFILRTHRPVL
jgi:hypothetical protein